MNSNTCNLDTVLMAVGLVVMLVALIPFVRYGFIERKTGLASDAYIKLGLVGWILNTIWISIMILAIFRLDENRCYLSDQVGIFAILICPGLLSMVVTFILLVSLRVERLRRIAIEEINSGK